MDDALRKHALSHSLSARPCAGQWRHRDGQTSRVGRRDRLVMDNYKRVLEARKWIHRGEAGGHWGLGRRERQTMEAALQHHRGASGWQLREGPRHVTLVSESPVTPHHAQDKFSQALLLGIQAFPKLGLTTPQISALHCCLTIPYSVAELCFSHFRLCVWQGMSGVDRG